MRNQLKQFTYMGAFMQQLKALAEENNSKEKSSPSECEVTRSLLERAITINILFLLAEGKKSHLNECKKCLLFLVDIVRKRKKQGYINTRRYIAPGRIQALTELFGYFAGASQSGCVEQSLRSRIPNAYMIIEEMSEADISVALLACETGKFLLANSAYCRLMNCSEKELLTKTYHDITRPEYIAKSEEIHKRVREGYSQRQELDKIYYLPNGESLPAKVIVVPFPEPVGGVSCFMSIVYPLKSAKEVPPPAVKSELLLGFLGSINQLRQEEIEEKGSPELAKKRMPKIKKITKIIQVPLDSQMDLRR